jgi:broad specificity polyphosphatase/5'/3'-nucleotidase SurE
MKYTFFYIIIFILLSVTKTNGQTTTAIQLADKIAQKMKDTLSLNQQKKTQIYNINLQLHDWKTQARQQYANSDSLGRMIQRVENKRDSLYRNVLTTNQYNLYLQKKRNLVNNN